MQSQDTTESANDPAAQSTSTALAGRTALVTGASRGLGRALALDLARAGARVVAVARSREALEAVAADAAGPVETVAVDIGHRGARTALADSLRERGDVSILINNAATVEPLGQSWSTAPLEAAEAYELNVLAPAELAAAVIPGMATAGWGRIVNISSGVVAHPEGMVGGNTYVATKAALEAHTLNLAAELRASGLIGVTANIYRPGVIDTAMQEWIRSQDPNRIGHQLRDRFNAYQDEKVLISPAESSAGLMRNLTSTDSGAIWNVAAPGH